MIIRELTLLSTDLPATLEFYSRKLGLPILRNSDNKVSFQVGTSVLTFEQTQDSAPRYHFAFSVPAGSIGEAMEWSQGRLELIQSEESPIFRFDNWAAQAIYFFDNNQNIVELISRDALNSPAEHPFSVNSLLGINEIGLVFDSPLQGAGDLMRQTGLDYFSKGPVTEEFVALGDESGLFVISNPRRNWFPTQQAGERGRIKTKVEIRGIPYDLDLM